MRRLYTVLTYQPFYRPVVNQYHGAFAAVFAWGAIITLLAEERNKPADQVHWHDFCWALAHWHGFTKAANYTTWACIAVPVPLSGCQYVAVAHVSRRTRDSIV